MDEFDRLKLWCQLPEATHYKAGDRRVQRVRVTAQLIDTATDHHLWAERYDRDLEDIFTVQDDVTREITAALEVAIPQEDLNRLGRPPTKNVEAYGVANDQRMSGVGRYC